MKIPPLLVLVLLAGVAVASSADQQPSDESPDVQIRITSEVAQRCEAEGGCELVSRAYVLQLMEQVRNLSCRSRKEI